MTRPGPLRTIIAVIVVVAIIAVSLSVLLFGEPLPPFPADRF